MRPLARRPVARKSADPAGFAAAALLPGSVVGDRAVASSPRPSGNRLLAALQPDILALLEQDLRHVSVRAGETLLEPGQRVENVYFPQTGLVSLMVISRDGIVIDTTTVGREGAVGLHGILGGRRSFTRAQTQIAGTFSRIGAERFAHMADGSAPIRDLILRYTHVLLAETQQGTACNAMHSAGARLCRWLLQCADRTGREELELTQEALARMLGVQRTTVTLLAHALKIRGLVKYRRGHIVLLDRKGIEACACECYQVMRHENLTPELGDDKTSHGQEVR